jgi:hypothetical protein
MPNTMKGVKGRVLSLKQEEWAVARGIASRPGWMCIEIASFSLTLAPTGWEQGVLTIPQVFNSKATLEVIGFRPEVAAEIFDAWEAAVKTLGYHHDIITDAMDYVIRRSAQRDDASRLEYDLRRDLEWLGAHPAHIDLILRDPAALDKTASAAHWMLECIDAAWVYLESLDEWIGIKRDERLHWFWTALVFDGWMGLEHVDAVREAVLAGGRIMFSEHGLCVIEAEGGK